MGYIYLLIIKAGGYLGAAYLLKRIYHAGASPRTWIVGLTRLLLGLIVALAYGGAWILLTRHRDVASNLPLYLGLLFPMRIVEWMIILWLFFDKASARKAGSYLLATCGAVWSYALDGLALVATALPDKIWIS